MEASLQFTFNLHFALNLADSEGGAKAVDKSLTWDVQDGVLVVTVSGERPGTDAEAAIQLADWWQHVAIECKRLNLHRLLIFSFVEAKSSAVTIGVFSGFARFGFESRTKIAIVQSDANGRRIADLGVKIAIEEGWKVQIFSDESAARQWLSYVVESGTGTGLTNAG